MTRGLARTSSGVPSAIFWPMSSTATRSEVSIPTLMSCSIRITVTPHSSLTSRTKRAMSSFSSWLHPPIGSSRSRIFGASARGRPSSTRFGGAGGLRVQRERSAGLDAFLQAVGERAGRPPAQVLDAQESDDVLDALSMGDLFLLREPPVGERAQHARLHVDVAAEQEVVEDGHAAEEGDVLEGARDAELGDAAR